jgi:hypothetical protein
VSAIVPGGGGGGGSGGTSFLDANGAGASLLPLIIPVTIQAAATTSVALGLPAGCIVQVISGYVETAVPTATSMQVGTAINSSYYAPSCGTSVGSTFDMWTSPPQPQGVVPFMTNGSETILITPNATPSAATGVLDLHILYWQAVRATS